MINIKIDSRKVTKGDIFVAIKGLTVDGHDYIDTAISNGASKIVCEHGEYSVETLVVPDTKKWLEDYLYDTYKDKLNKIKLIGMTGTNGKTTTCFLTYQLLNSLGCKCAYIGTIGYYVNDTVTILNNTTPEIIDMYDMIVNAVDAGCEYLVMEVSSHALLQRRVAGLEFRVEAFSNLTEDHLDYHKSMDAYLNAKTLILDQLSDDGVIIVNHDDEYSKYFEKKNYLTLGFNGEDYKILSYEDELDGTLVKFKVKDREYEVKTNLKCKYNVYNYLTCLAIANNLGFSVEEVLEKTNLLNAPKGRCEQVKVNGGIAVVDYAHTPDAVDKIISAFNENKKGRVITIVGCGGDRDPIKRPIMGNIAATKSDYVIFTSDNPRTEKPEDILDDILKGVTTSNYEVEVDRPTAIVKGLDLIKENDVLLILGKGHEDYQEVHHVKHHLDDMEEVKKYIDKH